MQTQPGDQVNVEYFFRLLYNCFHGGCHITTTGLSAFLANLWLWIIAIGYILSVIGLLVIVYCMVRLFELRKREEEFYTTLISTPGAESGAHPRWERITTLAEGPSSSEWREAIIEADILLDETLTNHGYEGATISEKLQSADKLTFTSLQDAWEAHKVRNQIAHEGSAFNLSPELVHRTIARYEKVFREFKVI